MLTPQLPHAYWLIGAGSDTIDAQVAVSSRSGGIGAGIVDV